MYNDDEIVEKIGEIREVRRRLAAKGKANEAVDEDN